MTLQLSLPSMSLVSAMIHAGLLGALCLLTAPRIKVFGPTEFVVLGPSSASRGRAIATPSVTSAPAAPRAKSAPIIRRDKTNPALNMKPTTAGDLGAESQAAAAETGSASAVGDFDPYVQRVVDVINSRKTYPEVSRRLGQQGVIKIQFTVNHDGEILAVEVIEPAPHLELNQAAQKLVMGIGKFDPFPEGLKLSQWQFTVPIEYRM